MKRIFLVAISFVLASYLFGAVLEAKSNSDFPLGVDPLRNTSRLTDSELRALFENLEERKAAELLDLDNDGLADFTGVDVRAFIERMKIILSDRRPFVYKRDAEGNPTAHDDPNGPFVRTTVI